MQFLFAPAGFFFWICWISVLPRPDAAEGTPIARAPVGRAPTARRQAAAMAAERGRVSMLVSQVFERLDARGAVGLPDRQSFRNS
ncbi:hypothetical protein M446_5883 [Methylobacterium sp. 4-46]|nr:hypothetical protein M446_5883 [Methylobacterium sp. 4-46]